MAIVRSHDIVSDVTGTDLRVCVYGRDVDNIDVVFIHGGGWMFGGVDTVRDTAMSMCIDTGLTVASVSYTKSTLAPYNIRVVLWSILTVLSVLVFITRAHMLRVTFMVLLVFMSVFLIVQLLVVSDTDSTKYRHPTHVLDVAQCIATVCGTDSEHKFVVVGHSAGGHLAALLGTCPSYLTDRGVSYVRLRGVVSLSGIYSYAQMDDSVGRYLLRSIFHDNVIGLEHEHMIGAFPLTNVRPGVIPFLLINAGGEFSLYHHTLDFATAIKDVGGLVDVQLFLDRDHLSIRRWKTLDDSVRVCVLQFITRVLMF